MKKKWLERIPLDLLLWLANILFRVRETKDEKQRLIFRELWTTIWEEEGYSHLGEPLEKIAAHYAVFDAASTDLLLYFLWFPIGTMRLIWESEKGLPVLNDFAIITDWSGPAVEFTLLVLRHEWRGLLHLPSLVLWREGYRWAKKKGVKEIGMAADKRLFRLLSRILPFRQIGPEMFYEGSVTIPAFLNIQEAEAYCLGKGGIWSFLANI